MTPPLPLLPLLVTPGMGIGPEVTQRALAEHPSLSRTRPVVLLTEPERISGDCPVISSLSGAVGPGVFVLPPSRLPGEPMPVAAIRQGAMACLAGQAAALVTGPIHKKQLADQGFAFKGHTDYLGELCGVEEPVMAFVGGALRVSLVTTHLPLMQVAAALSVARIARVVQLTHAALRQDLGLAAPRIAVCGLNPHAGEDGLLGTEEQTIIGPACAQLRAAGLDVRGPVSAETAFLEARVERVDVVVAMYHDQGLAPLKLVDFGRSVNWTLGLPILRTSVDHGTADSLVGTGQADPASMAAALHLAHQILSHRAKTGP